MISRMVLNKGDFSRLIGKGGQVITHIRQSFPLVKINLTNLVFDSGESGDTSSGAKGEASSATDSKDTTAPNPNTNTSTPGSDERLVSISSTIPLQVQQVFETVIEVISAQSRHQVDQYGNYSSLMQVTLLIEHSKAGRVVGPKGSNIQNIKFQSASSNLRIEKEVHTMEGVQLRRVTIEGSSRSIKNAHGMLIELLQRLPPTRSSSDGPVHPPHPSSHQHPPSHQHASSHQYPSSTDSLSLEALEALGVDRDCLHNLSNIRNHLSREFGLHVVVMRAPSDPFAYSDRPPLHQAKRLRDD
mmetsp:Transcript_8036/g.12009  ORF Transcript_8036/g.12009 Transcript_8036/m.12009 type:complete len:300 (-) Transcript_8036:89-988(-)